MQRYSLERQHRKALASGSFAKQGCILSAQYPLSGQCFAVRTLRPQDPFGIGSVLDFAQPVGCTGRGHTLEYHGMHYQTAGRHTAR